MREIKFRGKCGDRWVYGDLVQNTQDGVVLIIQAETKKSVKYKEVDPNTVGQFTGVYDKNGKGIYEGDIVEVLLSGKHVFCVVEYGKTGICAYVAMSYSLYSNYVLDKPENFKVIGNIYDNPELLEVKSRTLWG